MPTSKLTFDQWKDKDDHVLTLCGLGCDDLDDYRYADAYEEGKTPSATARAVVRAAGGTSLLRN